MYLLTNNSLKDIELTIDFRESANIGISTNPNNNKDTTKKPTNKNQINFIEPIA